MKVYSNGSPRVVHVVPQAFSSEDGVLGGAERYAFELARHMAREVPTTLVTFGKTGRDELMEHLKVRTIGDPWYVRGHRSNPFSTSLFLYLLKADVVHCHQQHVLASTLAALFCRFSRRRVFVSDLGGGGWDISMYMSTDRWYDGHLHISEYSRRCLGHKTNPSAHVILGGVDVEKFSPDDSVRRERTALFVGRILPHKGINYLIDALPDGVCLEIIGSACDARFLDDLHRLTADKRVKFRHGCDDAALVDAHRRAMCVVLPSVYRTIYGDDTPVPELLGQALLEGMACGAPAICTDVASMPEIVEDGVSGFVVPPNDPVALGRAIQWLVDNPAAAAEMGRAARARVLEKFTWSNVVTRCLSIYGQIQSPNSSEK